MISTHRALRTLIVENEGTRCPVDICSVPTEAERRQQNHIKHYNTKFTGFPPSMPQSVKITLPYVFLKNLLYQL